MNNPFVGTVRPPDKFWGCHPDPRLGPILGLSRSHPASEGVPSRFTTCFVFQHFGPIQVQKTFRYLWRFYSLLFRGFFVARYFFVAFSWLFCGFFVALFCLEKQCLGLFRGFFVVFSWLFRGFFVAPVLGKIYAYSPWNSLLTGPEVGAIGPSWSHPGPERSFWVGPGPAETDFSATSDGTLVNLCGNSGECQGGSCGHGVVDSPKLARPCQSSRK